MTAATFYTPKERSHGSKLIDNLTKTWSAPTNPILNYAIMNETSHSAPETNSRRLIKSEYLRNEGFYTVNVKVNDLHSNYIYESTVNFVPTLCHWFEVIEN